MHSETSVQFRQLSWHHISGDGRLRSLSRENLKYVCQKTETLRQHGQEIRTSFRLRNLKEGEDLEDLGVDGRFILILVL